MEQIFKKYGTNIYKLWTEHQIYENRTNILKLRT